MASRQLVADQSKALGDLLPVAVDVRSPVELDVDNRQSDTRHRPNARDAGYAVHLGLDDEGDELLDLGRRQALGLGHDRDGRLVEVRQDVDRQVRRGERAPDDEDNGQRHDEEAVAQRVCDEKGEHRRLTVPD
jgi:hypothetical protein